MNELKIGDVFELKKGMDIYADIPERFIYQNTPNSDKITNSKITVGDIREVQGEYGKSAVIKEILRLTKGYSCFNAVSFDEQKLKESIKIKEFKSNRFDTNKFIGEYVVTSAGMGGGSSGYDSYPDGWHIIAKKLNNGKFDKNGLEVSFYQSGCFTVVNKNIPVIRKMKNTFI